MSGGRMFWLNSLYASRESRSLVPAKNNPECRYSPAQADHCTPSAHVSPLVAATSSTDSVDGGAVPFKSCPIQKMPHSSCWWYDRCLPIPRYGTSFSFLFLSVSGLEGSF